MSIVALFVLPPAPYVTLIKSGLSGWSCDMVLYMLSTGVELFGGNTSKDNVVFFLKSSQVFIYFPLFCYLYKNIFLFFCKVYYNTKFLVNQ